MELQSDRVIMQGMLTKKGWRSWEPRWFKLKTFELVYYKNEKSTVESGSLSLREITSASSYTKTERPNVFVVVVLRLSNFSLTHYLQASSAVARDQWIRLINEAVAFAKKNKDHTPTREPYKETRISAMKNTLLGKVVSSCLGKSLIREFISDDAIELIESIKLIVANYTSSTKKAERFENLTLKLAARVIILITNKDISKEQVLLMRDPLFLLWSDSLDMLEITFIYDEDRLVKSWQTLLAIITDVLFPYFTMAAKENMKEISNIFATREFIYTFYQSDKFSENRNQLRTLLRKTWEKAFIN